MNSSILSLIELTLKGTAVLLAGYGGMAWLARASAAQRSLCWLGVFATMLFLPLALVTPAVWTLPVRTAAKPPVLPKAPEPVEGGASPVDRPLPASIPLGAWLGVIYGCGFVGVLGFRLLGTGQLWKLRGESVPDAEGQAIVNGWRADVGMRRSVQVCSSPGVTVPMTYGAWFPVILLPAISPWRTADEWNAALQHEFAHVRHGDAARRWLGTIVVALWWPHPLVWAAFRAWNLEQERSCDDAVLQGGANAADYAQQLLDAARHPRISRSQSAAALIMAMPGGLETRLRSITSPHVNRSPARRTLLLPISALAIAATLCGIAFQTQSATAAPQGATQDAEAASLTQKANAAIIPQLSAREATVADLIEQITKASGIKIFYTPKKENKARVTLQLANVPASEAIRYVAGLCSLSITYKKDGIYLTDMPADKSPTPPRSAAAPSPQGGAAASLITKEWKIPAGFPGSLPKSAKPGSAVEDLTAAGIVFPAGSSAVYSLYPSRLIVRNTQENLDLIDALIEASLKGPARR
jgi:beta-lactamase regulating signal transducer with metallopeptidase domain